MKKKPGGRTRLRRGAAEVKVMQFTRHHDPVVMCVGCGQVGHFLCRHCAELQRLVNVRCVKLRETLNQRFAVRP
jgi:hypothetical protein